MCVSQLTRQVLYFIVVATLLGTAPVQAETHDECVTRVTNKFYNDTAICSATLTTACDAKARADYDAAYADYQAEIMSIPTRYKNEVDECVKVFDDELLDCDRKQAHCYVDALLLRAVAYLFCMNAGNNLFMCDAFRDMLWNYLKQTCDSDHFDCDEKAFWKEADVLSDIYDKREADRSKAGNEMMRRATLAGTDWVACLADATWKYIGCIGSATAAEQAALAACPPEG